MGDYGGNSLEVNAYESANIAENTREDIMEQIREQLGDVNNIDNDVTLNVNVLGTEVDISSGPGALLLDDALQTLSTIQQVSAQMVASKNRGQKEMNQLLR